MVVPPGLLGTVTGMIIVFRGQLQYLVPAIQKRWRVVFPVHCYGSWFGRSDSNFVVILLSGKFERNYAYFGRAKCRNSGWGDQSRNNPEGRPCFIITRCIWGYKQLPLIEVRYCMSLHKRPILLCGSWYLINFLYFKFGIETILTKS